MATEPLEALGLSLSAQEIDYILDELKLPALPGIARQDFQALGPEQQALVRETARQSLLARDLLIQGDGGLEINPLVLGLLAPEYAPEHSILLGRREGPQGQRLYHANSAQGGHVLRWESQLGIEQFLLLNSPAALQKAVLDLMELAPSPASNGTGDGPTYRLPVELFEQAQAAPAEAGAILGGAGVPEAAARALAAAQNLVSITAVHVQPAEAGGNLALLVIQGQGETWLADYSEAGTTGQIALRRVETGEVVDRLAGFFEGYAA